MKAGCRGTLLESDNCDDDNGLFLNCLVLSLLMRELGWETWGIRQVNYSVEC